MIFALALVYESGVAAIGLGGLALSALYENFTKSRKAQVCFPLTDGNLLGGMKLTPEEVKRHPKFMEYLSKNPGMLTPELKAQLGI